MPRPKTKKELIETSLKNFKKLEELVDSFTDEQITSEFPAGTLNRNVTDVIAHLHHWNLLMIGWYNDGMTGKKPDMPASGYTWKTLPDLNKSIQEKYKHAELKDVRILLNESFNKLHKIIQKHSDDELFEKKRYKWTGSTSLGSYLVSTSSSHYDWAYKLVKKSVKVNKSK